MDNIEKRMAVLPEMSPSIPEVTLDDLQVGDPELNTPEQIDQLKRIIWKRRHLLIGKGNDPIPRRLWSCL